MKGLKKFAERHHVLVDFLAAIVGIVGAVAAIVALFRSALPAPGVGAVPPIVIAQTIVDGRVAPRGRTEPATRTPSTWSGAAVRHAPIDVPPADVSCAPESQSVADILREAERYRLIDRVADALGRYRCAESRLPRAVRSTPPADEIRRTIEAGFQNTDHMRTHAANVLDLFNKLQSQLLQR